MAVFNPTGEGGVKLPSLTNPGSAGDLRSGKQLIDQNGKIVNGNLVPGAQTRELEMAGSGNAVLTIPGVTAIPKIIVVRATTSVENSREFVVYITFGTKRVDQTQYMDGYAMSHYWNASGQGGFDKWQPIVNGSASNLDYGMFLAGNTLYLYVPTSLGGSRWGTQTYNIRYAY